MLGLGVLHLGTDGAGSLRIPAAFTGVFGMKPSFGQVPTFPPSALNVLAHQGPITRTVADAALMLSVIAQPDARDMAAWNTPAPDFTAGLDDGVRGLRVALSMRLGHVEALNPEIEAAVRKAARVLQEQGAIVEEADPPLAHAADLIRAMWWPVMTGAGRRGGTGTPRRNGSRLTGDCRARAGASRSAIMWPPIPRAAELHNAMLRFHERYDLLLTPTMPVTALKVGREGPDSGGYRRRLDQLVALHLSVQSDAAARRLGALRLGKQRPADGRADRRRACGRTGRCCGRRG